MSRALLIGGLWWQALILLPGANEPCPVSSSLDDTIGVSSYPERYFRPDQLVNQTFFPCHSGGRRSPVTRCTRQLCPLTQENVESSLKLNTQLAHLKLCSLLDPDVQHMNLIVLGGSQTVGHSLSTSCCQGKRNASTCQLFPSSSKLHNAFCSWSGYFYRWLQSYLPFKEIHYHNLAKSGHTSYTMYENLLESLRIHGIEKLSRNDLVLIDHSENDACAIVNREELFVANGLELLIRSLIQLSSDSTPMMVLIEHWPHDNAVGGKEGSAESVYIRIYRKLAAHYGIPLFSYREVVWSEHIAREQPPLKRMMTGFDLHPPWHGHLLAADIYAASIISSLKSCSQSPPSPILEATPPPLYNSSRLMVTEFCDPSLPYLLDARPNSTFQPVDLPAFESRLTGWTEYVDRHGEPGWMINNSSMNSLRKLEFNFNSNKNLSNYIVKVKYLRTHFNAGKFSVKLCGRSISSSPPRVIDALSPSFSTYKVSTPHIFLMKPTFWETISCSPSMSKLELLYELGHNHAEARDHQKVKIFSVQICLPLDNHHLLR